MNNSLGRRRRIRRRVPISKPVLVSQIVTWCGSPTQRCVRLGALGDNTEARLLGHAPWILARAMIEGVAVAVGVPAGGAAEAWVAAVVSCQGSKKTHRNNTVSSSRASLVYSGKVRILLPLSLRPSPP